MNILKQDLFDALYNFCVSDLFRAAKELFILLGYNGDDSVSRANEEARSFVYLAAENKVILSHDEILSLNDVRTVSFLFEMNEFTKYLIPNKDNLSSIIFLAVDLQGRVEERSHNASYITEILCKCFKNPVIVICKHDDSVLFSGQVTSFFHEDGSDIYLSDWISTSDPRLNDVEQLSGFSIEYVSSDRVLEMYFNMLYTISRPYQVYHESLDYLGYGLHLDEYLDGTSFKYKDRIIGPCYSIDLLEIKRTFYQTLYGNDYVPKRSLARVSNFELNDSDLSEDDIEFIAEVEYSDEDDLDYQDDIDESYFDDPILLLQLLDEKRRTEK